MNKVDFQIVPFESKYRNQIRDVVGNLLVYTGVVDKTDLPIDDKDLGQISKIYSGKGGFWVAVNGDKIIGTVAIKDMGSHIAKLKRMFVLPEYHGTGVGKDLLNYVITHAKKQGFTKMILNSHEKMKRAHHFYEKNGFIRIGENNNKYHYELEL